MALHAQNLILRDEFFIRAYPCPSVANLLFQGLLRA